MRAIGHRRSLWGSGADNGRAAGARGQQGFGINTTNDSRVVIFGGGIPIKRDGMVIGAVGASGGSVKQDIEVAEAAVAGLTDRSAPTQRPQPDTIV